MVSLRRNNERGYADHGWLKSFHSFAFASYYDPRYLGVSALRVLNDDRVAPGAGFPTHPHRDMEILSYVLAGALEHKDSMGNVQTMTAGEFQLMSAGTGVTHSEYNPLPDTESHFLQIWIAPDKSGIAPGYQQQRFPAREGVQLIAAPAGQASGALQIQQDARVYRLQLPAAGSYTFSARAKRPLYLHIVSGEFAIKGMQLGAGDALLVREEDIEVSAVAAGEALVFDLPAA